MSSEREIATEHNSTIIVPIPLDLFQPYPDKPDALGRRRRTVAKEIRQAVVRVIVL